MVLCHNIQNTWQYYLIEKCRNLQIKHLWGLVITATKYVTVNITKTFIFCLKPAYFQQIMPRGFRSHRSPYYRPNVYPVTHLAVPRKKQTHTHCMTLINKTNKRIWWWWWHTHSVLTAFSACEPGLAGCPLNSPSPLFLELHILLEQA